MKYMLLFWVDHPLARTAQIEVRPFWDAPWDH
jgi:hypothetical protein